METFGAALAQAVALRPQEENDKSPSNTHVPPASAFQSLPLSNIRQHRRPSFTQGRLPQLNQRNDSANDSFLGLLDNDNNESPLVVTYKEKHHSDDTTTHSLSSVSHSPKSSRCVSSGEEEDDESQEEGLEFKFEPSPYLPKRSTQCINEESVVLTGGLPLSVPTSNPEEKEVNNVTNLPTLTALDQQPPNEEGNEETVAAGLSPMQQACLVSALVVLDEWSPTTSTTPMMPHSVLIGLWTHVVLPLYIKEEEEERRYLALETWTTLVEAHYLTENDGYVMLSTSALQDSLVPLNEWHTAVPQWKDDFFKWLCTSLLVGSCEEHEEEAVLHEVAARYLLTTVVPALLKSSPTRLESLVGHPDYAVRLVETLQQEEHVLELTQRYLETVLVIVDRPTNALLEAWQSLLQQHVDDLELELFTTSTDYSSASSGWSSSGEDSLSSSCSKSDKRRERRRQRRAQRLIQKQKQRTRVLLQHPLELLWLGKSLFYLGEAFSASTRQYPAEARRLYRQALELYSIVAVGDPEEDDEDEEDEQESSSQSHQSRDKSLTLHQQISLTLAAECWWALSKCLLGQEDKDDDDWWEGDELRLTSLTSLFALCCGKSDVVSCKNHTNPRMHCLHMAVAVLESAVQSSTAKNRQATAFKMTGRLRLFRDKLRGEVYEAVGRVHLERNEEEQAKSPLEEAVKRKRAVLTLLRDELEASSAAEGASMLSSLWTSPVAPLENGKQSPSDEIADALCLSRVSTEKEIEMGELSLAQSLEYNARIMHARGLSMPALSSLQEALLLKTSRLGNMDMEVARLNSVMADVHDDLLQWEAALPRRRDCLKIRMQFLSKLEIQEWFREDTEIFQGVVDALKSVGNTHRILEDYDTAIGCYVKLALLARRHWEVMRDDPDQVTTFFGFDMREQQECLGEELRTIALPNLFLDELRHGVVAKRELLSFCGNPLANDSHRATSRKEVAILSEVAQSYQTVISLFKDKEAKCRKEGNYRSGKNLADVIAEPDVPLLLSASYQLGIIHMHFGHYQSAMHSFEISLQSMWILDPSSSDSSGSDSYSDEEKAKKRGPSRKLVQRRRNSLNVFNRHIDDVHEDGLYHAVGLCRAACNDHDQAVRFHMTALRYARRMHGANSLRVATILSDAAKCYWYMHEYEKALEFWSSCSEILAKRLRKDGDSNQQMSKDAPRSLEYAKALYHVGATLCAVGRFRNHLTFACLEEAYEIFSEACDKSYTMELACCRFYMSLTTYRVAGSDNDILENALNYLKEAAAGYHQLGWLPSFEKVHIIDAPETGYEALQAHLFNLQGAIVNDLGNSQLALSSFQTSFILYDAEESAWSLHRASVLHSIGSIYKKSNDDQGAITCFNDALALRRAHLGPSHEAVAETLHQLGDMRAREHDYVTAMELYNEAKRIFVATDGKTSSRVATVLLQMGALEARECRYRQSLEYLTGALVIRNHRTKLVFQARMVLPKSAAISIRRIEEPTNEEENTAEDDKLRKFNEDLVFERQQVATVLHCMGNVYRFLHDLDMAIECYDESIEVWKINQPSSSLSDQPPVSLADTYHNLGCTYAARKDYDKALHFLTESLKLKRGAEGVTWENPNVGPAELVSVVLYNVNYREDPTQLGQAGSLSYATTLHRIGMVHDRMGSHDVAVTYFESALQIQRGLLGEDDMILAKTLADIGNTLYGVKHRRSEAIHYYQEALGIRKSLGATDSQMGDLFYRMGNLYEANQDRSRAITCFRQAVQVHGRQYVYTIAQHACQAVFLRPRPSFYHGDDPEPGDIFRTDGFTGTASIEERDQASQDHFRDVCVALRQASQGDSISSSSDICNSGPEFCISLELYIYSLVELMHFLAKGEWRESARRSLQEGIRQLGETQPSQDSVIFQMLYLVQA